MIRSLRRRHRRVIVALALVVPVVFALSLLARREPPPEGPLVLSAAAGSPGGDRPLGRHENWAGLGLRATLRRDDASRIAVVLQPSETLEHADLLAYWSATGGKPAALPSDAFLLGPVATRGQSVLTLPEGGDLRNGRLILYSLARHAVIAAGPLSVGGPE